MSRRGPLPERNLEPPENYDMEPDYCNDCEEDECLLDYDKVCPKQEKAELAAHTERKAREHEKDMNNNEPWSEEDMMAQYNRDEEHD
jgi:hypothetical protein